VIFSQVLLKRLAVLAVAAYGGGATEGTVDPAGELDAIQPDVFQSLLDPTEVDTIDSQGRARYLRLLGADRRAELRRSLALNLGSYHLQPGPDTEALLESLAHDPSPVVQRTMAVQLGLLLERWPPLERTALVAEWATSPDPDLRAATARALCRRFFVLGREEALALLSQDEDPLVRRAALSAVERRIGAQPR
jgi:hypothetical protein